MKHQSKQHLVQKGLHKYLDRLKTFYLFMVLGIMAPIQSAMAALPVANPPSTAPAQGDFIGWLKGTGKDIGLVAGLLIALVIFLVCGYAALTKFNDCRRGRAEWGEMIPVSAGAVVAAGAGAYFLGIAATII